MTDQSGIAGEQATQAEAPSHMGGTGPNEFEQAYHARLAATQEAAAPEMGNGQPPNQQAAAYASTGDGATNGNMGEETFLDPEQFDQFDTTSPEYKAMQAAFTRKMQALAEKEKALTQRANEDADQQFADPEAPQPQPIEAIFSDISPAIELPEELEPYRGPLVSVAVEVAKQVVTKMQAQAEQQQMHAQRAEMANKIRTQLRDLQSGPRAADFDAHRSAVIALAQESPGLINRIGLEGILSIVAGPGQPVQPKQPAPQEQAAYLAQQQLAQRRQAATYPPSQSSPRATTSVPFQARPGASLNDAVAQAFEDAMRRHG